MFGLGVPGNGMFLRAAHAQLFPGPVTVPQGPSFIIQVYKRATLGKRFGEGPVPINTLYTE